MWLLEPAPFGENHDYPDIITHCCVCRQPRAEAEDGLNYSGCCRLCWEHIPERFRTPPNRAFEQRRMLRVLRDAAKQQNRRLPYMRLIWNEERNTWTWRQRGWVLANGDVDDYPRMEDRNESRS